MSAPAYQPHPMDTSKVELTSEIAQLIEQLSRHTVRLKGHVSGFARSFSGTGGAAGRHCTIAEIVGVPGSLEDEHREWLR